MHPLIPWSFIHQAEFENVALQKQIALFKSWSDAAEDEEVMTLHQSPQEMVQATHSAPSSSQSPPQTPKRHLKRDRQTFESDKVRRMTIVRARCLMIYLPLKAVYCDWMDGFCSEKCASQFFYCRTLGPCQWEGGMFCLLVNRTASTVTGIMSCGVRWSGRSRP